METLGVAADGSSAEAEEEPEAGLRPRKRAMEMRAWPRTRDLRVEEVAAKRMMDRCNSGVEAEASEEVLGHGISDEVGLEDRQEITPKKEI